MARTVTLSTVREAVRTRYDLPAFSTTTFVTTATVNAWLNESLQALYGMLQSAWGDDYFTTQTTITTTASQGYTAYPTRFVKLRALAWVRGTNDVVKLERAAQDDIDVSHWTARAWTTYVPSYRLTLDGIRWYPVPSAQYTLVISYVQAPADLSADGDTFDAGPNWEEWVICDVCAKIADREEKDPSVWLAKRGQAELRIRESAPQRDEWRPQQVRDLLNGERDYGDLERRQRLYQRRW